jgi:hypothetical protein
MNVQLSNVWSDISGVSGRKIIQAILDGARDPGELAALVEPGVKATPQDIANSRSDPWQNGPKSLAFNWLSRRLRE